MTTDTAMQPVSYSIRPELTPAQLRRITVRVKEIYNLPLTWQERLQDRLSRLWARVKRAGSIGR